MNFTIDKSKWSKVKLNEVCEWYQKDIPNNDQINFGIDYYVTANHIDSDSLKFYRFGELSDGQKGPTITKHFKKGDLLLSTRSVALRKAAIAPVDGVTGEKLLVLRIKENSKLSKEMMPFIFQSIDFWEFAQNSASGSVNKFTSWTKIREYDFFLPPKKDQAKLAELLWSIDEVNEKYLSLKNKYDIYFERLLNDLVSGKLSKNKLKWREFIFGDLGETFGGLSGKIKTDFGEGSPFITYMNIFNNSKVNPDEVDLVKVGDNENQNKLKYGDILLTGSSETPQELGMSSVILDEMQTCYLNSFCFGFRLHNFDALLPEFARYLMRGQHVRKFMFKHAQGSTRFNLSKITLKTKLKITLPDIDEQKKIYEKLDSMEQCVLDIKNTIKRSENLRKSLINQIF
jgi:type I restriction enzyme, S subunit